MGVAAFAICSMLASVLCFWAPPDHSAGTALPDSDRKAGLPKVAIIIDDLGYDLRPARKFFSLGLPVTLAVIPYAPYAAVVGAEAAMHGYETIAHIPMEPRDFPGTDPGPGGLLLNMDRMEIDDVLERNLSLVPGVSGVSNHMGSAFTGNREKMETVLGFLKRRDMFFVDSITTPGTVARHVSGRLGVKFAARDVFLDNDTEHGEIERQLELLLMMAERNGSAVGIGHPYPETIEVLSRHRERLLTRFDMVPISRIVRVPTRGPSSEAGER